MLMREVGSSRDVRARPARVLRPPQLRFRRERWSVRWGGVHAACGSGVVPAAMAGSHDRLEVRGKHPRAAFPITARNLT